MFMVAYPLMSSVVCFVFWYSVFCKDIKALADSSIDNLLLHVLIHCDQFTRSLLKSVRATSPLHLSVSWRDAYKNPTRYQQYSRGGYSTSDPICRNTQQTFIPYRKWGWRQEANSRCDTSVVNLTSIHGTLYLRSIYSCHPVTLADTTQSQHDHVDQPNKSTHAWWITDVFNPHGMLSFAF